MYNAVIKPAFPAEVYCIPICCAFVATKRMAPQRIPPIQSVLRLLFTASFSSLVLNRSKKKMHGNNTRLPIRQRMPLNVNGSTYPYRHSVPQMQLPRQMLLTAMPRYSSILSSAFYTPLLLLFWYLFLILTISIADFF